MNDLLIHELIVGGFSLIKFLLIVVVVKNMGKKGTLNNIKGMFNQDKESGGANE